jgi:hypothetical protein
MCYLFDSVLCIRFFRLMLACFSGNISIVEALLKANANLAATDNNGTLYVQVHVYVDVRL